MRDAAAKFKQRLLGRPAFFVLPDRIENVLPIEWVLQFRREDRQTIQEQDKIDALLAIFRIIKLADNAEDIRGVKPLCFRVQTADWLKIGEIEMATAFFDSAAQDFDHTTSLHFARNSFEQFLARI